MSELSIQAVKRCGKCEGTGKNGKSKSACKKCHGAGKTHEEVSLQELANLLERELVTLAISRRGVLDSA